MPPVDLDNPTSWETLSDAELLKMAEQGVVQEPEEPKAEEPKAEEPKAEEPKAEEPTLVPSEAIPEGAAVLAADGKNTIPYSVLKDARDNARAAQVELQRLRAELDELKAQPVAPPAVPVPAAPATVEIPAEVQARFNKIKEDWGPDIAAQAEQTWRLEQRTLQQQQVIDQLLSQMQSQQQVQQRTETEQIEDAIAASPKLSVWARSEDSGWFDRSVELHTMLMKTDRGYASLNWFDRMRQLPEKVEALYGPSMTKVDAGAVKAQAQAALERPPTSLSDLSSGALPEKNEFQKVNDLEGMHLQNYMSEIAKDPRKLDAYLRRFG
jgi:hypothetical protein